MKIKHTEFSFEESLKFLQEEVAPQLNDGEPIAVFDKLAETGELPNQVVAANCTAMYVKVTYKGVRGEKYRECARHGVMNLVLRIVQSTQSLRLLEIQADGSLLAVFDTPMKKEVEEIVNVAAQVRSVNEVVLTKLNQNLTDQVVTVGMDYGQVTSYNTGDALEEKFFAGSSMLIAKQLTDLREDCVIISDNIYINLSDDFQNRLFVSHDMRGDVKYHYAPLINIRMHKWVLEQQQ